MAMVMSSLLPFSGQISAISSCFVTGFPSAGLPSTSMVWPTCLPAPSSCPRNTAPGGMSYPLGFLCSPQRLANAVAGLCGWGVSGRYPTSSTLRLCHSIFSWSVATRWVTSVSRSSRARRSTYSWGMSSVAKSSAQNSLMLVFSCTIIRLNPMSAISFRVSFSSRASCSCVCPP